MRKAEITIMRRMDLQSLHSSPNTDSSIIPTGLIAGTSRSKTPPLGVPPTSSPKIRKRPENEEFDTFTQLSSPPQTHSPSRLPASPALEGLMRQDGHSGLSAAVEMFERTHGRRANQRLRLPSRQHSPTHRPLSQSSVSSQEVVEQQLTQEDDVVSQSLLPSELPTENELVDTELRWPTDDESDVLATAEIRDSQQLVSNQKCRLGDSPNSARGQNFRCGSLNVSLDVSIYSASPPISSQAVQSQPFVLQTQAPYSSQATGWSQT
ncbi:hypothetical protein J3R83DRAFT_887 [Lanmaoa asiatica]|nr:hypothetical protein J3R83DRAFT_887 [Lanmaoa asiatica]